ncbi:MAG: CRTAC1 family protein [Planctomycetota bacterium]|nr:CRTAC1 family protein [Planctomycetota bacterium]
MFCGPTGLQPAADLLFINDGSGGFLPVAGDSAPSVKPGFGLGVIAFDFNRDGFEDIYVANDSSPNFLLQNKRGKTFRDVGVLSGAATAGDGRNQSGMGVAAGDIDGDGFEDLVVTNFSDDYSTLYRNDGGLVLEDVSDPWGLVAPTFAKLGWGASIADLDNDGWPDLVFASGHVYPQADDSPSATRYRQTNQVFRNLGKGRFEDITGKAGPGLGVLRSFRGLVTGDLDGDGDLDLVFSAIDDPPLLLENASKKTNHFLSVLPRLRGGSGSHLEPGRLALGSVVTVVAGGRQQIRYARTSGSYLSSVAAPLHFGLGGESKVQEVRVRWPDGTEEVVAKDLPADRLITVVQSSIKPAAEKE